MTLRANQKETRFEAILEAAVKVFEEHGFADSTIAQIAQAANLSPRTVYNYFQTKDHILFGLFRWHTEKWLDVATKLAVADEGDPTEAITNMLSAEWETGFKIFATKDIWRNLIMVSLKSPIDDERDGFYDMARTQAHSLEQLLRRFMDKGKLRSSLQVEETAWLLYSVSRAVFRDFVTVSDVSIEQAKALMRQHVDQIYAGLKP